MDNQASIIITAGGIGKRMNAEIPKQFIEVDGLPVLMHTILAFYNFSSHFEIIVSLPEDWIKYWHERIEALNFRVPHQIVPGGKERYHSIKNALSISTKNTVLIHDGVRPLVSQKTINNVLEGLKNHTAVIPVISTIDSLRNVSGNSNSAVNRNEFVRVQTPQGFHKKTIEKAYSQGYHSGITDDATLAEEAGVKIHLVEGNENNIKLTTPFDIQIFQLSVNNS